MADSNNKHNLAIVMPKSEVQSLDYSHIRVATGIGKGYRGEYSKSPSTTIHEILIYVTEQTTMRDMDEYQYKDHDAPGRFTIAAKSSLASLRKLG